MRSKSLSLAAAVVVTVAFLMFAFGVPVVADEPMEVDIVISPSTVVLDSHGVWVTVHAEIPYGTVAGLTVSLDGIPVEFTKSDSRGELVAKFALDSVKEILEPGTVTLTLSGMTYSQGPFTGTDIIRVIAGKRK